MRGSKSFLRIVVSGTLVAVLGYIAYRQNVWEKLRAVPASSVLSGLGLLAIAWLVNSRRWGMLLSAAGIRENPIYLASMYFIGMFFSMILPTGAGGDAARMWDVSRRNGKPAAAIVATLQERLLGMGVSMIFGLSAAIFYFSRLPAAGRLPLLGVSSLALIASAVFLYPRVPVSIIQKFWPSVGWAYPPTDSARETPVGEYAHPTKGSTIFGKIKHAIFRALRQASEVPPLTAARLLPILAITAIGVFVSIAAWWALGDGVGLHLPYSAYCLVVPMVWIISMAPSLGGVGVRETGFVVMMRLFDVPSDRAVAVAALYLIVQTILACIGGLFLLGRVWSGTWRNKERREMRTED
jgi:uncharacterized membrane protein YbhN (UPF0104 family)